MDQVKAKIKENTKILDPYAAMVPALVDGAAKADINPGALLGGIGAFFLLILLLMQGWTIMVTFVAVVYPAVKSLKAFETKEEKDDKRWLSYWIVYGTLNLAETFFACGHGFACDSAYDFTYARSIVSICAYGCAYVHGFADDSAF